MYNQESFTQAYNLLDANEPNPETARVLVDVDAGKNRSK